MDANLIPSPRINKAMTVKKNNATKITRISSTNPKRGEKKLAQFHGINPTTFPDVVSYLSATNHI
jgi:hypothetical protein